MDHVYKSTDDFNFIDILFKRFGMDMSVQIFAFPLVLLMIRKEFEFHSSKIDDKIELHEYKINSSRKQKFNDLYFIYKRRTNII